ncbi:crossover junction endodeoxyribonuclease RuvC [candidate division WWE3 bacterium CG10_big_fil_rev_8_21_14_0_10_32_10]|uniref:Crossover junction endodeoxyribonuclease RuvC n=1 Tax=candidate division WWE3 bacterium CG10_big_fil_rev_8_21_14_0_10_32_10 TaxID=1975090 RepID=A0A2H0R9F9_UNCKA|nr:MAG: crossover junction endodeoxyribonuclease RuvC [candidate division WWE3 bacterium CG10_big_fil_rev_8_21_14_0_10_32_10]
MIILGIDPGTTTTGFGILQKISRDNYKVLNYGVIHTMPKIDQKIKLFEIDKDIKSLIKKYKPNLMSIEKLFYNKNPKTIISVSQARGVCLLNAGIYNLRVFEYTPLQVKNTLVGYGRADKAQVQYMVKNILNLSYIPKPDDAADALAIAICAGLEIQ